MYSVANTTRMAKKFDRKKMSSIVKSVVRSNIGPNGETSAAAAVAKMSKKKDKEIVALQIEVETEVQWRSLLRREGLIVVDVYSSWCGPCTSMVNILKRLKIDINDERLWYAVAQADDISDLMLFKDQSEPTWLFIGGGKPVKVYRGANAPALCKLITNEFEHELKCIQGKARRAYISVDDEASRRKKAENEAIRLAEFIKDEERTAEGLNEIRRESSIRLKDTMNPYTILVVQSFLLETGVVTMIRDEISADFRIEQERVLNLSEDQVRRLYRIPYEIPDPTDIPDPEATEVDTMESTDILTFEPPSDIDTEASRTDVEEEGDEEEGEEEEGEPESAPVSYDMDDEPPPKPKPKKKKGKTIKIQLPEGLTGNTLLLLLESVELRKLAAEGLKPDSDSKLQTADDLLQIRVGPVKFTDAVKLAPTSMHAVYGKGEHLAGVWCPRRYDDKRYVMINFFPRFVTDMLIPPPSSQPKYCVVVLPPDTPQLTNVKELEENEKDILAEAKIKIPPEAIPEMLTSWNFEADSPKKEQFSGEFYCVCFNKKNLSLKDYILGLRPVHYSVDAENGKLESAKFFPQLKIKVEKPWNNPDVIVEKFLARTQKRVGSPPKDMPTNTRQSLSSMPPRTKSGTGKKELKKRKA